MKEFIHLLCGNRRLAYSLLGFYFLLLFVLSFIYNHYYELPHYQLAIQQNEIAENTFLQQLKQVNTVAPNWQPFLKKLTKKSNNHIVSLLEQKASASSFIITRLQPASTKSPRNASPQRFYLEATGNYLQLLRFLLGVSQLPIAVIIQSLTISTDNQHQLHISMALAIASV